MHDHAGGVDHMFQFEGLNGRRLFDHLLKKLRDGDMSVTTDLITIILKSVDMLKVLLQIIKTKDAPTAIDLNEDIFAQAARRQLDDLGVSTEAILTLGKRRTLRIKDKEVVGYEHETWHRPLGSLTGDSLLR